MSEELDAKEIIDTANNFLNKYVERTNTLIRGGGDEDKRGAIVSSFLAASKLRGIMLAKMEKLGKEELELGLYIERTGVADDIPEMDVKN